MEGSGSQTGVVSHLHLSLSVQLCVLAGSIQFFWFTKKKKMLQDVFPQRRHPCQRDATKLLLPAFLSLSIYISREREGGERERERERERESYVKLIKTRNAFLGLREASPAKI